MSPTCRAQKIRYKTISQVLLEKLPIAQPQEFPNILSNMKVHYYVYDSPTVFPILSKIIQSIPPNPISPRSVSLLSSHPRLGLQGYLFPSCYAQDQNCVMRQLRFVEVGRGVLSDEKRSLSNLVLHVIYIYNFTCRDSVQPGNC
jgi:hypothetical protein